MNRLPRLISVGLLMAVAPSFGAQASDAKAARTARRTSSSPAVKPDYANLSYGPYPNNKLDLWLAKSAQPTPLVVFIHGGGFVGGDESSASPVAIRRSLESGASFAAINYRFRSEIPIQTVLRDCARDPVFALESAGVQSRQVTRGGDGRLRGRGHVALAGVPRRSGRSGKSRPGFAGIFASGNGRQLG